MPAWYLAEPRIKLRNAFYLGAFAELSSCRVFGFSVGPIPWTAIVAYADRVGLDSLMCEVFVNVIRAMDERYLRFLMDEQKAGAAAKTATPELTHDRGIGKA